MLGVLTETAIAPAAGAAFESTEMAVNPADDAAFESTETVVDTAADVVNGVGRGRRRVLQVDRVGRRPRGR